MVNCDASSVEALSSDVEALLLTCLDYPAFPYSSGFSNSSPTSTMMGISLLFIPFGYGLKSIGWDKEDVVDVLVCVTFVLDGGGTSPGFAI
ncbi:hypothetical protein L1987_84550 [Smallanthus sonchifolius]|uniref:Uncharacterized protein n=1 Tax=Smallanthus sonchifolius TaxID=185202 RepID=A0ACB8YFY9_9ASTR|nr:hypothetical protein L1987_84550 [Smallanthus sonchifolius]